MAEPFDNVWRQKFYQRPVFSVSEALAFFRESLHPQILDNPMAPLTFDIELNMRLEKDVRIVYLLSVPIIIVLYEN